MDKMIYVNDVYIPFLKEERMTQIYYGGSSSGKSFFLAQRVVMDNLNGVNWLLTRNIGKTIRNSLFNEIKKAISAYGVSHLYSINKSDMVITYKDNGKQILFAGLDDVEKLKSITPANGVLERIWIEEATEVKREAYLQLKKRLRGYSPFKKSITLSFNPILKTHWIYQDFFKNWQDNKTVYKDNELSILKTTYKDNKFLTPDDIYSLENESDEYFRNVYTYGNWGVLGHVIFKNWHVEDLSNLIPQFDHIYNGIDFGYSSDPNALIKIHLDKKHKKLYVFDEWYQAGMGDDELVRVCKEFFGNGIVTCDSAEPKTIDYLSLNGINAISAVKGADSINRGIRYLQGYEIIIHESCQNFKNEIEQYHWKEDKYGNAMAKPVDANNHLLDALRYAIEDEMLSAEAMAGVRL